MYCNPYTNHLHRLQDRKALLLESLGLLYPSFSVDFPSKIFTNFQFCSKLIEQILVAII